MGISWGTIKSLAIFFGPILIPKAISYYRRVRAAPRIHGLTVQPVPPAVQRALAILFGVSLVFLIKTLPIFSPENLFKITQSRLQIPTDVLFTRLTALRPTNHLTPTDEALRAKFVNLESRLLYLQYGPDTLATCPFCTVDDPRSYFYYAVPSLLAPHLFNTAILALVTSAAVTGREGDKWRRLATLGALGLAILDLYLVGSYKHQGNARATRLGELDFYFWTARLWRALALAALDGMVGLLMFLSSTNRAFVRPPSTAERLEVVSRGLGVTKTKLNAMGIVKNTAIRDDDLRVRSQGYWSHEVRLMREVMEEREVVDSVNNAIENRIDVGSITRDAENYAQSVLLPLQSQAAASSS